MARATDWARDPRPPSLISMPGTAPVTVVETSSVVTATTLLVVSLARFTRSESPAKPL